MAEKKYIAKAFVSCSLRQEDQPFVEYVCRILDYHGILPFGTVGKFSASPENPVELMKKNIPAADMVVIVATPRYIQKDIKTGVISLGLSEMVHVETGMAIASNKPVVVFAQEGTPVGSVIPNITQYVILNGKDYSAKQQIINSLLSNAYKVIQGFKENKTVNTFGKIAVGGLAFYGGYKILESLFSNKKKK